MYLRKSLLRILPVLTFAFIPFLLSSCISNPRTFVHGDVEDVIVVTKVPIKKEQEIKAADVQRLVASLNQAGPYFVPWSSFVISPQFAKIDLPEDHVLEDSDLFKMYEYLKTHNQVFFAAKDIKKGNPIMPNDLAWEYRHGPNNYDHPRMELCEAKRNIRKGEDITADMLGPEWHEISFAKRLIKKGEVLDPQLEPELFECKVVKNCDPNSFDVPSSDTYELHVAAKDIQKGALLLEEDVRDNPKNGPPYGIPVYQQVVMPVVSIKAGEVLKPEYFMLAKVPRDSMIKTDITKIESLTTGQPRCFTHDIEACQLLSLDETTTVKEEQARANHKTLAPNPPAGENRAEKRAQRAPEHLKKIR